MLSPVDSTLHGQPLAAALAMMQVQQLTCWFNMTVAVQRADVCT
jgi:hypothetical protein